jgi:Bacteriophage protein gp37
MSANSKVSWCDHTFSPFWGCRKASPECAHCYAEGVAKRFAPSLPWDGTKYRLFDKAHWHEPVKWNAKASKAGERAKVFCGSMCDVFDGNFILDDLRARLWKLIDATPSLDWLLLTKRPENIERMLPFVQIGGHLVERFSNVWLGTTVGCKASLPRVDVLRMLPATVHFLSCEPLLEDIGEINLRGISWVIVGCESGPGARHMKDDWALSIRDQCQAAGVAFFLKQRMACGKLDHEPKLNGRTWRQFP